MPPSASSLRDLRIGVSASPSPDAALMGLPDGEVDRVLGGLAAGLLAAGATLVYGGRLDPGGQGGLVLSAVRDHAATTSPPRTGGQPAATVYLAWSEQCRLEPDELARQLAAPPGVEVVCLDPAGQAISEPLDGAWTARREAAREAGDEDGRRETARSLSSMRRTMAERTDARILLGGRRSGFAGAMPGLVEEALLTLDAGRALFPAAGLGGVTADIARELGVDACAWAPPQAGDGAGPTAGDGAGTGPLAQRTRSGRWRGLGNGLSAEEGRMLAAARDADEIVRLVALGMERVVR